MSCILRQATRARAFFPAHLPKNWQSPQRSLWAKSSRYANPTRVSSVGVALILRWSSSMSGPSGRGPTIRRYTSRQLGAVPAADSLSSKASSTSSIPATAQRSVYAAGHVHGRRLRMIWPRPMADLGTGRLPAQGASAPRPDVSGGRCGLSPDTTDLSVVGLMVGIAWLGLRKKHSDTR